MDLVENGDLSIIELKLEPLNAAILLIILLGKTGMVVVCGSTYVEVGSSSRNYIRYGG